MNEAGQLSEVKEKLEKMLDVAEEYGIDHPRHTQILLFDDGDYTVEVRKGESLEEITEEGFEKLHLKVIQYKKSKDTFFYRKLRQEERHPTQEVVEEEKINLD